MLMTRGSYAFDSVSFLVSFSVASLLAVGCECCDSTSMVFILNSKQRQQMKQQNPNRSATIKP
jgi:hypothetical protein